MRLWMPPPALLPDTGRRRFLRGAGAGALATPMVLSALGGPAFAQEGGGAGVVSGRDLPDRAVGRPQPQAEKEPPLPPSERVGYAIVGLGKFALGQIIPAFAESKRSRLAALVSGNRDKALATARQYGVDEASVYDYQTFDRIADNGSVDVVYVILPNALHAEYTIRAFQAGKHVMCEKPMANTVEECHQMIEAGRKAGKKLMVAYRAHHEPHNVEAIRMARGGELGQIKLVTSDHGRHLDPKDPADQWRMDKSLAGGGSLYDIGIYSLQAARYITGEEPVEIRAMVSTPADDPRFRQVEDTVTWQMAFPSGALALCSSSYSIDDTKRITALGSKAGLRLDPATNYEGNQLYLRRGGSETHLKVQDKSQFAGEMDHLAQAIKENKPVNTPGEEGLQDVRLMQMIYESAREGRPVKVAGGR